MNKPGEFRMVTPPDGEDQWKWKRWRWDDGPITDRTTAGDWQCSCGVFECDHIAYLRGFTDGMSGLVKAILDNPEAERVRYGDWEAEPMP